MKRKTALFRLNNFSGGENYLFPSIAMPTKYSTRLQNCHISDRGGIAKIPGYVRVNQNAVAETLKTGFEFKKKDGTTILLTAGGGKIYKVGNDDELAEIKAGLDATAKVFFAQMNDICIMTNGVDAAMKYDGTNVTALGGVPDGSKFKKCHTHKGRVWAIDGIDKMTAFHSALNAPEDYTTDANAGYIDFRFILPKGDELLDIVSFAGLIVFYFRQHVAIYSGTDPTANGDFYLIQLIEAAGAVDTGVVLGVGTDLYGLYDTGIQSLKQVIATGTLTVNALSQAIENPLKSEMAINNGNIYGLAHYPKNNWAVLLVNQKVFIYSYLWKAWGHMIGANVYGMFHAADGSLYLCGDGYLYKYGTGYSFDGADITMMWETGWINLSKGPFKVYPKLAEILCYPGRVGEIRLDLSYDFSAPMIENFLKFNTEMAPAFLDGVVADVWDNVFYMDTSQYPITRLPLFGGGKSLKMIFTNTSSEGPFEINDIMIQGVIGGL